jgi:ABC-type Na+ efflux pump permease subunit
MTKPIAEDEILSIPAAQLSHAAPREWAEFKAALKLYAETVREDLVRAQIDELQRAQGRAQNCAHLVRLFDHAVEAASRITDRASRKK